jgi:hypothetical protein
MGVSCSRFKMYQLLRDKAIRRAGRRAATLGPKSCARATAFQGGVRHASRTFELQPASSPLPANTAARQHKLTPLPRAQELADHQNRFEFHTTCQRFFSTNSFTDQRLRTKAIDPKMDVQLYVYDLSQVSRKWQFKLHKLNISGSCT